MKPLFNNYPRPVLTPEDKSRLDVVVQSKNREMPDGTMAYQDFSTIRDNDDMYYACQMVELRHSQSRFNMGARIFRGNEVIYSMEIIEAANK